MARSSADLKRLNLRQLDERIQPWLQFRNALPPRDGWIRAIRGALGMGLTQFARRLGTKPPSASLLEKNEVEGAITLNSLRRAAEALDCTLVYALVPNTTLTGAVRQQARKKARDTRSSVSHSMMLEAQGLDSVEAERQEHELMQRLLIEFPRSLWDDENGDVDGGGGDAARAPGAHGS